jgi:hypothetical protein
LFGLLVALHPTPALANAGLPMIGLYLPPAWLLLIPIIFLEATHGRLRWRVPFVAALRAQALANGVSTLVGVPLSWVLLATLELICCGTAVGLETLTQRVYAVTVQAPWLIPYEEDLWWMVPASFAVLSVLFCAISIAAEYPFVKRAASGLAPASVWRWVVVANVYSYSLLILVAFALPARPRLQAAINEALMPITEPAVQLVYTIARAILGAE